MADAEDPAMKQVELELKKVALEAARFELDDKKLKAGTLDLSKVTSGSLAVDGDAPMFGALLATQALRNAVEQAVPAIKKTVLPEGDKGAQGATSAKRVLVTTKAEMVDADANYAAVDQGLEELIAQAVAALASPADGRALAPPWSMVAGTLPGVLSLLAAKRSVKSFEVTPDHAAAAHLVASELAAKGVPVLLDDFRTLPRTQTAIQRKLMTLRTRRQELQSRRQETPDEGRAALTSLIGLIDAFLTRLVINEAGHSLYSDALRWTCLYEGDETVDFVILVNARPGSATQSLDDRALMMADLFSTVTSMGVSWTIIDAKTSLVRGGGVAEGIMSMNGKIGGELTIGSVAPVPISDASSANITPAPPWVAG